MNPTDFRRATAEAPLSLPWQFLLFLRENKKWWLLPILLVFAVIGLLTLFAGTGAAPFIYTIF